MAFATKALPTTGLAGRVVAKALERFGVGAQEVSDTCLLARREVAMVAAPGPVSLGGLGVAGRGRAGRRGGREDSKESDGTCEHTRQRTTGQVHRKTP
ncbi:MAG TPA: hypothetical protein PKE29_03915 [Phycisphaerales bacterium]|nr:hypothetical protein [Phycisphaerales bacterium]